MSNIDSSMSTRDEAYKSLLSERRKLLHERTAQAIEAVYSQRLQDHYVDLAHHYGLSGNAAKAVEYLLLAGEQAVDRGAYAQSGENAQLALKLVERLPDGIERLRAELGVRLLEEMVAPVLYGGASVERLQVCQRVCELSERLGNASALLLGLANVAFVYWFRLELPRTLEIARRCTQVIEQSLNGETPPYIQLRYNQRVVGSPRGLLPEAPTEPDGRDYRIRLFSTRLRYVTGA
jgi:hypothetical protein